MDNFLTIAVRVQPGGSRSEISGVRDGRLKIRTTATPVDGEANKDVVKQLASAFAVPKSRVRLKSGARGRNKVFIIERPEIWPEWLDQLDASPSR